MLSINRRFARSLCIGLSIAAGLSWYFGHTTASLVLASVAAAHLLAALVFPAALTPSRIVLESLVKAIGHSIAVTVLSLFYYLLLFPFSLAWKLLGKDALRRRPPEWRSVPARDNDPETLRRLF
ncbi:hypothetical protein [Spirochaeta africana]|uniref:Uncharacterized protein n=1 Tax=Spirochaeta africana (strain ATCC 700263 / DSM 8902 / Z-7692) TaxID=889378 RepID=H9ULJ4_SPIAZ|nr:hypothetical protein [Spirochaeta africana]AFG38387.1 hypothetical protein Spiaf_2355 [Spirochaeta africana DSM 8902]